MRRRKRAHRRAEETAELLASARERGLTNRELADELGVHPNTVLNWARRERATRTPGDDVARKHLSLLPVRIVSEGATAAAGVERCARGIELVLGDIVVRLPRSVDEVDLRTVLDVLGDSRC